MATLKNKVFLSCALGFLLFHMFEGHVQVPEVLSAYLDDFLCLPILLSLILLVQRRLIVQDEAFKLPVGHIIVSILYISLLFELVLPGFSVKFIGDPFDVLAYSAGAALFYFSINKTTLGNSA